MMRNWNDKAMTVMPRAECKLYISGADSPRLTWIYGLLTKYVLLCVLFICHGMCKLRQVAGKVYYPWQRMCASE